METKNSIYLSSESLKYLERVEKIENHFQSTIHTRNITESDKIYFEEWWNMNNKNLPICYDFIEFSSIADGLNFNGLYYYSIDRNKGDNFYNNNNEEWQTAGTKEYILFGYNEFYYYTQSKITGKFVMFDNAYNSIIEEYDTFSELLMKSLDEANLNEFAEEILE